MSVIRIVRLAYLPTQELRLANSSDVYSATYRGADKCVLVATEDIYPARTRIPEADTIYVRI